MFPIDPSKLPTLKTRRGLLIVDPQNDFLAEDGALVVKQPEGLPQRIADLVTSFRQNGGDIIWARSQFQTPRSTHDERILTSDGPALTGASAASRGRRTTRQPGLDEPSKCPEAFLGPAAPTRPKCVRPDTPGIEMHPTVQETALSRDHVVVKSHYSAFRSEQLLPFLRKRLVTELYICGSLTNIGVMATAVDAARHGYEIAVVEDCCGYRSTVRHHNALQLIREATGCDVLTTEDTLNVLQPRTGPSQRIAPKAAATTTTATAAGRSSTVRQRAGEGDATSSTAALESSLEKLSLNSNPVVHHDEPKHAAGTAATRCLEEEEEEKQVQPGVGSGSDKEAKGKETETATSDGAAAARSDSPNADAPPSPPPREDSS